VIGTFLSPYLYRIILILYVYKTKLFEFILNFPPCLFPLVQRDEFR
jgi:hypothetical protein